MTLPLGFNVSSFVADFVLVLSPLISIAVIIAVYTLLNKIMKRG